MSLVKVTSKERNGKVYAKDVLVSLKRITQPVIENSGGDCIIYVNETPEIQSHVNRGRKNVQYIIDENLVAFVALQNTKEMFKGTVVSRDGRIPVTVDQVFITDNIVGVIVDDPSGSKFLYEEDGGITPVEYVISETVAAIDLALT